MRILGIDPGYAILGWGIVDIKGNQFKVVDYRAVTTDAGVPMAFRLQLILIWRVTHRKAAHRRHYSDRKSVV